MSAMGQWGSLFFVKFAAVAHLVVARFWNGKYRSWLAQPVSLGAQLDQDAGQSRDVFHTLL